MPHPHPVLAQPGTRSPRAGAGLHVPPAPRRRRARRRRADPRAVHASHRCGDARAPSGGRARRELRRRVPLDRGTGSWPGTCSRAAHARARRCPFPMSSCPRVSHPARRRLIVVHNHPSGDPSPSPDDARLTVRLCARGRCPRHGPARPPDRRRRRSLLQLQRSRLDAARRTAASRGDAMRTSRAITSFGVYGSPQPVQGSSLRSDPALRGSRP